jgi:hypothetical protein
MLIPKSIIPGTKSSNQMNYSEKDFVADPCSRKRDGARTRPVKGQHIVN